MLSRFHRNIFLVATGLYLITAWFSIGFHHFDEHYQILEFAGYKIGFNAADNLAWEFPSQIRPGLQPFLAFVLIKLLSLIQITDPFIQAFFIRCVSAAFSLLCIRFFVNVFLVELKSNRDRK